MRDSARKAADWVVCLVWGQQYAYFVAHNLKSRFLRQRAPLLNGFKITHRCNLQCAACPFWRQTVPDIPYERALQVLDRLEALGVRLLIIEGGEPFLWRDGAKRLEDLVRESRRRFFFVGVVTNGTLPIETSADVVWVSVDGLRETHDRLRGGSFDRAMAHIRDSGHSKILANVTFNSANWRETPELIRFLSRRVKGITIQFYYPYDGTEDLSLTKDQRSWVLRELLRLKRDEDLPILDSNTALRALDGTAWRCHPWLISTADPDGAISVGCYLRNRAKVNCLACGFAAHAEISLAYDGSPGAILAGRSIFGFK